MRAQRLVHGLDADAVVAQLAGDDQVVEDAEDLGAVVDVRVRAMQLQQIERVHLEVASGCASTHAVRFSRV